MEPHMLLSSLITALTSASILSHPNRQRHEQPRGVIQDRLFPLRQDNTQAPLAAPRPLRPNAISTGTTTLEVETWSIFGPDSFITPSAIFSVTPIGVGTPNQVFRAYLDLDFSGLLLRSTTCTTVRDEPCGYGAELGFAYNSSTSVTHENAHEDFHFTLPGQILSGNVSGNVSRDSVTLSGFELENVTIGAVEEYYDPDGLLDLMADLADGALGLAPPNLKAEAPYTRKPMQSTTSHLLSDIDMALPIVTFTIPAVAQGEFGHITLGGLPAGHEDVEYSIPFGDLSEDWNIPLSSLTLEANDGDGQDTKLDTTGLEFYPSLSVPDLMFPPNLTRELYKNLHALESSDWIGVKEYNCSYRGQLPDLSFNFPIGHGGANTVNLTIPERDYTVNGFIGEDEACFLTITEFEGPPGHEDVVAVGLPLWQNWHVAFDMTKGKENMGLIRRELPEGETGASAHERRNARQFKPSTQGTIIRTTL